MVALRGDYNYNKKNMIGIDDVYQTVLALANKEQRGYITPQEFNLFAEHAQMDIFRQYFYFLDRARKSIPNNTGYADTVEMVEEKISMFEVTDQVVTISQTDGIVPLSSFQDFYRLTMVAFRHDQDQKPVQATEVSMKELTQYNNSTLIHSMSSKYPYYTRLLNADIKFHPLEMLNEHGGCEALISYVKRPKRPNWTYLMSGENALYNSTAADHQDFELHHSEKELLVVKILQLAGINIKDGSLVQLATQEEVKKIQQENS